MSKALIGGLAHSLPAILFDERLVDAAGTARRPARQGQSGRWRAREAGAAPQSPRGAAPLTASAAAILSRQIGRSPLIRSVAATALATLLMSGAASTQTVEDRARAAATAAREKSADSDAIQRNYLTPGLAGEPINTVDSAKTFTPNIACQKTATLMEVLVQPSSTGDLGTVSIARDTDLDGTVDSRTTLPVPVSGICANGIVACQPGSWNACNYFRWDVDAARNLKLTQVDMPALAGCYCVNNSCGTNLAWTNMNSVLGDLGGGMIGALTTADPRIGVAQAVINGPSIRYVGAQSTACSANPALPETGYRANPATMTGDAFAVSSGNAVFQALASSPIGIGTAQQLRHCTVERQVTVLRTGVDDVIETISGGYSITRNGNAIDWYLGSPADNSLSGRGCQLYDYKLVLRVNYPDRITDARLVNISFDDWVQIRVDGQWLMSDPGGWTSTGFPPGSCERSKNWFNPGGLDLRPYLTAGEHEILVRVAVADGGNLSAQVHAEVDDSCRTLEQVVDQCSMIAADPKCRIDSELVDGVQTFRGGVNTGLRPLEQTRVMGSTICPVTLTRDFFLKDRSYRCEVDTNALPQPDTSRGAYIIDHSTETMLADRARQSDGSFAESTRPFSLPDRGSVPACEPICKTRARKANADAAPAGVVGTRQNDPQGYDIFYHSCKVDGSGDNVCPAGPGEEIVAACGCLDDFPEAVVMMQTVRLAGADLVCTGTVR